MVHDAASAVARYFANAREHVRSDRFGTNEDRRDPTIVGVLRHARFDIFDLDAGVLHRTGSKVRQSDKRQPPAKIHGQLMPHLRGWRAADMALGITSVVHYKGERVCQASSIMG